MNTLQPAEETQVESDGITKENAEKHVNLKEINVFNSVISAFIMAEITVISYDVTCSYPCTGIGISQDVSHITYRTGHYK